MNTDSKAFIVDFRVPKKQLRREFEEHLRRYGTDQKKVTNYEVNQANQAVAFLEQAVDREAERMERIAEEQARIKQMFLGEKKDRADFVEYARGEHKKQNRELRAKGYDI